MNNFFHVAHEEVAVAVHGAVDPAVGVDAVVAPELADPIVMQVSDRGRHVYVDPLRVLPDEVVPGLLDVPWHADVLGPLLLRVEFLLPAGLSEDPQRGPVPRFLVVRELKVEERVLLEKNKIIECISLKIQ